MYQEYFEKTLPQLFSKRMVLTYRREFPFYVGLVLREAGRLACWALIAPSNASEPPREALLAFLASHEGAHVPVLDSQVTVKHLRQQPDGRFYLQPANPEFADILPTGELEILGVVVGQFRSYRR